MTDRYAVVGNPVSHSLSLRIHTAFAQQTSQDMQYGTILAPVGGFASTVERFRADGGRGLNVTVPFKLDAFDFAAQLTERAQQCCESNDDSEGHRTRDYRTLFAHSSLTRERADIYTVRYTNTCAVIAQTGNSR